MAAVQYTFTHKQYTEQHSETEYTEKNIQNNKNKHNNKNIQDLSKRFERFKFGIFYVLIVKIRYNFTHK